jgi:hypothetical protein
MLITSILGIKINIAINRNLIFRIYVAFEERMNTSEMLATMSLSLIIFLRYIQT